MAKEKRYDNKVTLDRIATVFGLFVLWYMLLIFAVLVKLKMSETIIDLQYEHEIEKYSLFSAGYDGAGSISR